MKIKGRAWLMSSILLLSVVFGGMSSVYAEKHEVQVEESTQQVIHNGSAVQMQTIVYNNRLYAPLRDLCSELGCNVGVNVDQKMIFIYPSAQKSEPESSNLLLDVDMLKWERDVFQIQVRGIDTFLETLFTNGTNFVPVRYTAELLNKTITWNTDTNSVELSDSPSVGFVNGEPVTERYFNYFLKPQLNREEQQVGGETLEDEALNRIRTEVFQSVAERVMLSQKAVEHGVHLSSEDKAMINANVLQGIQDSGGMENYRKRLEESHIYFNETVSIYQETYLINKFIRTLLMDVQASDDQLLNHYEENKEDYTLPEQRRAKHILIPFEGDSVEEMNDVKNEAQDILDQLNNGEDFDALMHEYSKDPGLMTYPEGYTFSRGKMVEEFEEAAFSMKLGEVSGLVETVYGYHILKLEEEIPAKEQSYEEVVEEVKASLEPSLKEKVWMETFAQWNEETLIDFQP